MRGILFALILVPQLAFAALVDPALQSFHDSARGTTRVLALMAYPRMETSAPRGAAAVQQFLINMAHKAWIGVWPHLQNDMDLGHIRGLTVYPINNSFIAVVDVQGLRTLAKTPGITKIYLDRGVSNAQPVSNRPASGRAENNGSLPYDLTMMGMDKVWAANPNLIGTGILVGHIDTGIDGRHPALAGKVAAFFNARAGRTVEPFDDGEHGTHTAGTIVGAARDGVPMGVAPGAKLVGAAGLSGYGDMLKAMEFMLNPDGNPQTNDVPKLVSNSWNCEGAPDLEAFYRAIAAWDAAGILPVFSAGNSGPRARSITKPHEHPLVVAVGATGPDGKVARFSSRGPGIFNGTETQKPDVAAPGVNIVSAVPGGRYSAMSGTSMAAPHVAGMAALMYQLYPSLTTEKAREIIAKAVDTVDIDGKPQSQWAWNAAYGFGHINAVKVMSALHALMGRTERHWANLMSPSFTLGSLFEKSAEVKKAGGLEMMTTFVTDKSNWIEGKDL